jgi:hypothetical protein
MTEVANESSKQEEREEEHDMSFDADLLTAVLPSPYSTTQHHIASHNTETALHSVIQHRSSTTQHPLRSLHTTSALHYPRNAWLVTAISTSER